MIFAALGFQVAPFASADTSSTTSTDASTELAAERAALEQQLAAIQSQINDQQSQLTVLGSKKNTLTNKIKQLEAQVNELNLKIKATDLQIDDVSKQTVNTEQSISTNEQSQTDLLNQISSLLSEINAQDTEPQWLYAFVDQGTLSAVLNEAEQESELTGELATTLNQAQAVASTLASQRVTLQEEQDDAQQQLSIQILEQGQLDDTTTQQSQLLQQTKGQESVYQAALTTSQKQAAAIQSQIYHLFDTETGTQITFGQAVTQAEWVAQQTGIRAAFVLAILTQESNLGQNVGTCNRPGDPPSKSWRAVMKPSRDQQPFVQITTSLGLNTDITPVSCPMHAKDGTQIGWGGGMGPAQFIPSTWLGWETQVAAVTGGPANPWDIRDAFVAAALKLKADGGVGSTQNEWDAAMRYFSGSLNPAYSFYGDSVEALATKYQNEITSIGS